MPLYDHQKRVRDTLQEGKNVILQAPTGAGKTRAAIEPFLHSINLDKYGGGGFLPGKMIYSVPMRVLARQFYNEYEEILATFNTKKRHAIQSAIQTGDMPEDPELKQDLIFATIDQTLSSFLMAPYSLSRGRANLNLGAILSSYLVFDEFHLYDPDSTLPTVLQMLRMLKGITPFVLMTATFSEELITRLAARLDAEVVGLSDADRESFVSLKSQDKTRRYHACVDPLTPETVMDRHEGRSVVICNTVQRAREMASRLKQRTADDDTEVILLHSQFLRPDRDRIEDNIRLRFGKNASNDGNLIVVATQAIEVGVDITSTVMHTELAPANTIIQRAGRCARYEKNVGDVYVYRYAESADGETIDLYEKTNPYSGRLQEPQLPATFAAIQEMSGQVLSFDDEQRVIDQVHGEADRQILNDLDADSARNRTDMFAAMRGDLDHVGELVRKVIAQPVTIHANPESVEKPYALPSFNLHPGVLRGNINRWLQRYHEITDDDEAPPFGVKVLHAEADPDDSRKTLYYWHYIDWNAEKDRAGHIPYGTLVVVHPVLASYNGEDGFIPETGGGWQKDPTAKEEEKSPKPDYTYRLETYAEHIRLVYKAAFEDDPERGHFAYWHELEWAARRLAERLNLSFEQIHRAAKLTVLLHDVGKLSTGWQGWVRKYQTAIGQPVDAEEAYAHTESQTDDHRAIEKTMGKRPPHAVEGAVAVSPLMHDVPETLRQAVFTAISRHHGAFTSDYKSFRLETYTAEKVQETLGQPVSQLVDGRLVKEVWLKSFADPERSPILQFFTYALLVRLLRRADNKGTEWGSKLSMVETS